MSIRKRNINKKVNPLMDGWMRKNTEGIFRPQSDDYETIDIFTRAQMAKKLIQALWDRGYEPFKRGTKEPERIKEALKDITLAEVENTQEAKTVKTLFD